MSCALRWFSRRRFFDFDGASASALHRLAWKRLSGKILSRLTGPAPCWMTKPASPARLALFGTGPFRCLRHEPGVRRSGVRRRAALSAHGMSSSPVPAPSAQQAARWEPFEPENLFGESPPRSRPAPAMTAAASATLTSASSRSRSCASAGAAKAETLHRYGCFYDPYPPAWHPHQNAGDGMRRVSAGGSREQRTGAVPVSGRDQRRTWKRPREQVLLKKGTRKRRRGGGVTGGDRPCQAKRSTICSRRRRRR